MHAGTSSPIPDAAGSSRYDAACPPPTDTFTVLPAALSSLIFEKQRWRPDQNYPHCTHAAHLMDW
ncbi:hypothetical protein M2283_009941 [Streptomyces pseudovenezuelae]|uniref:Uncharacterized protein n=1 Tax=Streptomyces pseudovenezuelae TaxID=67350 RepID=A0ABT6M205_9ACTN|nr:hypothetical protein [Streptomyces pseudovenezuelae]